MGKAIEAGLNTTPGSAFQLKGYEPPPFLLKEYRAPKISTPSEYFSFLYPEAEQRFGTPFLEAHYTTSDLWTRVKPLQMNEDFFAAMLGGNKAYGHDVVFYPLENRFYFYDPVPECYLPTTEEKLGVWLSAELVRCAEAMPKSVDIEPLFGSFRSQKQLKQVMTKAKAILAAQEEFFTGSQGHKRKVGSEIVDPRAAPPCEQFVKEALILQEGEILFLKDLYRYFEAFCQAKQLPLPNRRYLRSEAANYIQKQFGVGLRKDLKDAAGRWQQGFKHVGLAEDSFPALELSQSLVE